MTTSRKIAHLVAVLCIVAQISVFTLSSLNWLPIPDDFFTFMFLTLVAVAGCIYAGIKANRWW
ncbi:MAG: hypothetical protein WBE97_12160, partial [Candidatus Acidiferrales bacterium]